MNSALRVLALFTAYPRIAVHAHKWSWLTGVGQTWEGTQRSDIVLPHVVVDQSFLVGGWKNADISGCSARLDEKRAHRVRGYGLLNPNAHVVVASGFIFGRLDLQGSGPKVTSIEICYSAGERDGEAAEQPAPCQEHPLGGGPSDGGRLTSWAAGGRFRIILPGSDKAEISGITLIFRNRAEQLAAATSEDYPPKNAEVGGIIAFKPDAVTCELQEGRLAPRFLRKLKPDLTLLDQ